MKAAPRTWVVLGGAIVAIGIAFLVGRPDAPRDVPSADDPALPPAAGGAAPRPAEALAAFRRRPDGPAAPAAYADRGATASGARVEGTVATRDGRPRPGVEVRLVTDAAGPAPQELRARSGDGGGFRFEDAPLGRARVFVRGAGWVSVGLDDLEEPDHDPSPVVVERGRASHIDLVVVPAATVVGRVRGPDGGSIAGASVEARALRRGAGGVGDPVRAAISAASRPPVATATSGADGSFVLDGLVDRAFYDVVGVAEAFLPDRAGPLRATVEAPVQCSLDLREGRFVSVRVLRDTGEPIRGARVRGKEQALDVRKQVATIVAEARRRALDPTPTDDAGVARIGPFEQVPVSVFVTADGFLDDWKEGASRSNEEGSKKGSPSFERVVAVGTDGCEVRLGRGRSVSGRVVDEHGDGVAGAVVQGQRRFVSEHSRGLVGFESVRTGADGRFRLDGMPSGRLTIAVKAWDPLRATETEVEAGAEGVLLTLRTDAACGVVLELFDPDGRRVPKATVTTNGSGPLEVVGGQVTLDVDPPIGAAAIEITDPRDEADHALPLAPKTVTWARGQPRRIEVRLEPEAPVAGFVLGPEGEGVEGVLVAATPISGAPAPEGVPRRGSLRRDVRTVARSDPTGAFRLGGLAAGDYELSVTVPESYLSPAPRTVKGGDAAVELRLRRGVRPTLRVLDWKGAPVAGAEIGLIATDPDVEGAQADPLGRFAGSERTRTDARGELRLPPLDPTVPWRLSISPPDARRDLRSVDQDGWTPQDGTWTLARGWSVRGTVRDGAGRPVPGARVLATDATGEVRSGYSDEDGSFAVLELHEGAVELVASLGADAMIGEVRPAGPPVSTTAGARDVALVVDVGVPMRVRIENLPEGVWHVDAKLVPEGPDGAKLAHPARFDAPSLHFRGLKPGARYALFIAPMETSPGLSLWQDAIRGDAGELRVRLVEGRTVRGRLILPAGASEVAVAVARGFAECSADVGPDGRFEILGVPPGAWAVHGWAWVGKTPWVGETTVTGDEAVEIPLAPKPQPR